MSYNLFIIILDRISLLFLLLYLALFTRLKYNRPKTVLILGLCYTITSIVDVLALIVNAYAVIGLEIIFVQVTALLVSEFRDIRAIFVGVSAAVFVLIGDIIGNVIFKTTGFAMLAFVIQTLLHSLNLAILVKFTRKEMLEELNHNHNNWGLLTCIPILFYICVFLLGDLDAPTVVVRPENIPVALVLLVLSALTDIVCMRFIVQKNRIYQQEAENIFLLTYADGLERSVTEYQESIKTLSFIRHDIKHYGQMILDFIDAKQPDKVKEIIIQLNKNVNDTKQKLICENLSINSILTLYQQKAQSNQIPFEIMVDVPKIIEYVNEYELAAIIANLLNNALRATDKVTPPGKRFISINLLPVKEMYLLEVKNSYQWQIRIDHTTGLPKTNQNGPKHGFGLKSIQTFSNKYGALYEINYENNIFTVKMIIKM